MLSASASAAVLLQNSQESALRATHFNQLSVGLKKHKMTEAQIDNVAKDFEAVFLAHMLGGMFGESVGDELFGNADSKEIYQSLMMNEYGKSMADAGGIGIASHVKKEMLRLQEISA